MVCLAPQLSLLVYLHLKVGLPSPPSTTPLGPPAATLMASYSLARPTPQSADSLGLPAAALSRVLSAQLSVSDPPTDLDECFFFISLVVGFPYSLIFCQFWLFFVFKLLLSFFWLCKEAQCVYLCLHLGWKSQMYLLNKGMNG